MNLSSTRPAAVCALMALAALAAVSVPLGAAYGAKGPATELVSASPAGVPGDNDSSQPAVSGNGRYVAFVSTAADLVRGDTNGRSDVFVRDRKTGTTTRVSVAPDGAELAEGGYAPSISANGRYVAFSSQADNFVTGDTNQEYDVFLHDVRRGTLARVSVDSDGAQTAGDDSYQPSVSANGRLVAFASGAVNLAPADTNDSSDVFLRTVK